MEQWSKEIEKYKKKIGKYKRKILEYESKIKLLEETKDYALAIAENKRKAKPTIKVYSKFYKLMADIPMWSGVISLNEEYQDALTQFKGNTLYFLYHIRYVNKYKSTLPKELKNKRMSIDKLVKEIENYSFESYDSFKKIEDRKLKKMLCLLTGKEDIFKCLRADNKSFMFNRIDFSFFIFLLDTYDTLNYKHLKKGNYERITTDYLIKCRKGIELLLKYHRTDINIEEINNRFDTTFKMCDMYSSERLLQRMELLKEYLNTNKLLFKNSNETENIFIKANTLLSNIIYDIDKIQ